jgi:2-phosphoglycerate kinase
MARPLVINAEEQTRVPFLRGILTRSLQKAGLSFGDSYEVANRVRDELAQVREITTDDLRRRVLALLTRYGNEVVDRYENPPAPAATILVRSRDDQTDAYSRGRHGLDLMSSGLSGDEAASITTGLYQELIAEGQPEVSSQHLRELTFHRIRDQLGPEPARRYLVWKGFQDSRRPLLVLISGSVGCGKSTVATQLAHRLGIVRMQSTDMLREVMRMMVPRRLVPVLHRSTYNAWQALPAHEHLHAQPDTLVEDGYLTQSELVWVACEAAVQRAVQERVSLILEGVHVHPSFFRRIESESNAIVVPVMLAVLKRKHLRQRIRGRGKDAPDRRAERYLKHLDDIWRLQSFLLSEADPAGVPIVMNEDIEATVQEVVRIIHQELAKSFSFPS